MTTKVTTYFSDFKICFRYTIAMDTRKKMAMLLTCATFIGSLFFTPRAHAATCSVTFSGITFGNYDALSSPASSLDVNGSITVNCTGGGLTTVYITMSAGNSGVPSARYMTLASQPNLLYNIYTDPGHVNYWSNTPTNACTANNACLTTSGTVNVYGRIPGGQDVAIGSYADSLTATINY